jgi:hypothetical protein
LAPQASRRTSRKKLITQPAVGSQAEQNTNDHTTLVGKETGIAEILRGIAEYEAGQIEDTRDLFSATIIDTRTDAEEIGAEQQVAALSPPSQAGVETLGR